MVKSDRAVARSATRLLRLLAAAVEDCLGPDSADLGTSWAAGGREWGRERRAVLALARAGSRLVWEIDAARGVRWLRVAEPSAARPF